MGKSPSKYFSRLFHALPDWRDVDISTFEFEAVKSIQLKREYSFTSDITVFEYPGAARGRAGNGMVQRVHWRVAYGAPPGFGCAYSKAPGSGRLCAGISAAKLAA